VPILSYVKGRSRNAAGGTFKVWRQSWWLTWFNRLSMI
jgi:hypothetical protein